MKGSCPSSLKISRFVLLTRMLFAGHVSSTVTEDDIKCLKGIKNSLNDPDGKLSNWSFNNNSAGFLCNLVGVECWMEREDRLLSLQLRDMKLSGQLPQSLQYCQSLQTLDLSANRLSGTVPAQICSWLPYLVTLDLSSNDLSGSIPSELSNCAYLNNLVLSNNRLSGSIPEQLSGLLRLKRFSVANNDLKGAIPLSFENNSKVDFAGNSGLCGPGVCGAVFSILSGFGSLSATYKDAQIYLGHKYNVLEKLKTKWAETHENPHLEIEIVAEKAALREPIIKHKEQKLLLGKQLQTEQVRNIELIKRMEDLQKVAKNEEDMISYAGATAEQPTTKKDNRKTLRNPTRLVHRLLKDGINGGSTWHAELRL
ncbi:hypothetical protein ES319_D09G026600v1 [Gossypium barbadense]|uniref:Leucine-rich repeat-containing N-terminal plant-type domain-containing protein n=2 Tax=Gossypium TaxID=3633 RepID=A0A5J5PYA5_GOSBA|nr:hypothetical protein ES319_D09G026600v1 [Gossypium barbadense]TYG52455.1 hypothetical protein ES288_D09G029600v1 [Gossypium darwinii]